MLLKETALVRLLGLKIPMLFFLAPRVMRLDDEGCEVKIPLTWRSKNGLIGAMYFGALCAGADLAGGLNAARAIVRRHKGVKLVFADLQARFLKRADGDVVFRYAGGLVTEEAVRRADETGERVSLPVEVVALIPEKYGQEPVATFTMNISLKRKGDRPAVAEPPRRAAGA